MLRVSEGETFDKGKLPKEYMVTKFRYRCKWYTAYVWKQRDEYMNIPVTCIVNLNKHGKIVFNVPVPPKAYLGAPMNDIE